MRNLLLNPGADRKTTFRCPEEGCRQEKREYSRADVTCSQHGTYMEPDARY